MTKCDFCKFYYPGTDRKMTCNATNYELKYNGACKAALERFTAVSMQVPTEVPKPTEGDILDRLFGGR